MPSTVQGSSPTASAFMDLGNFDANSLVKSDMGMPADISLAFGRIVAESGKPSIQGFSADASVKSLLTETATPEATLRNAEATVEAEIKKMMTAATAPTVPGQPAGAVAPRSATPEEMIAEGRAALTKALAPPPPPPPQPMSKEEIQGHLNGLMASGKAAENIDKELANPDTPPEVKAALTQLKAVINGERPTLTDSQLEALSILQRHREDCGCKNSELQAKIDDPKTPPDLKQALVQMRDDPALNILVDNGKNGGGANKADGKWGGKDINGLSELPQLKAYNEKKAASYTKNYIPSDADPSVTEGRDMTENDALREMYLYSDYLPKKLSKESLQQIVDGDSGMKKCPPQVIAAAKFMLDHPASWSKATEDGNNVPSADGSIKRSAFLDNVGRDIALNADELETLKTLDENRDVFFKGAMTRKGLQKLIDDPATTPANKKAAQKLLDDPLLFGLLDNAKHGHSSNWRKSADDGKIGAGDIDAFMAHSTTKGKEPPPLPKTHPATTPEALAATSDMAAGEVDDPAMKKKKGGGLSNFFHSLGNILLKVGALALHIVSGVLSVLGKIPIIGELAIPLTMATEAAAGSLDVARVALNGGDVKHALKMMGLGVAGAGIAAVALPGMGAAVMKGAEKAAETVGLKAVEAAAEKGAATAAAKGAEKAGERVAEKGVEAEAKDQLKEELAMTTIDEAANARINQIHANQRRQSMQAMQGAQGMQGGAAGAEFAAMAQMQEARAQRELAGIEQKTQAFVEQMAGGSATRAAGAAASAAPAAAPSVVAPAV